MQLKSGKTCTVHVNDRIRILEGRCQIPALVLDKEICNIVASKIENHLKTFPDMMGVDRLPVMFFRSLNKHFRKAVGFKFQEIPITLFIFLAEISDTSRINCNCRPGVKTCHVIFSHFREFESTETKKKKPFCRHVVL